MNLPHLQDERSGRIATPSQKVPKRQSKLTETQIVLILKEADAGRPVDKIWRSLTYEEGYLHAYETVRDAQQGLDRYGHFYNQVRPHRALYRRA